MPSGFLLYRQKTQVFHGKHIGRIIIKARFRMRRVFAVLILIMLFTSTAALAEDPNTKTGMKKLGASFSSAVLAGKDVVALPMFDLTPAEEKAIIDAMITIYKQQTGKTLTRQQGAIAAGMFVGLISWKVKENPPQ